MIAPRSGCLEPGLFDACQLAEVAGDLQVVLEPEDRLALGPHLLGEGGVVCDEGDALLACELEALAVGRAAQLDGALGIGAEALDDDAR